MALIKTIPRWSARWIITETELRHESQNGLGWKDHSNTLPWAGTSSLDQIAQNKCSIQNPKAHLRQGPAAALLKKDKKERLFLLRIAQESTEGLNTSGAEGTAIQSRQPAASPVSQNHLKSNQNKRSPQKN